MALLNQFSFLLIAGALLLGLVVILRRRVSSDGNLMMILALTTGLVFAFVFFRPFDNGSRAATSIKTAIAQDQPVLLEFQSPYCIACMAVEPIVKRLESDYQDNLKVIRINVLEASAEPLLKSYRFQYTPTFVMLDSTGEELWRMVGTIDPIRIGTTLEALQQ